MRTLQSVLMSAGVAGACLLAAGPACAVEKTEVSAPAAVAAKPSVTLKSIKPAVKKAVKPTQEEKKIKTEARSVRGTVISVWKNQLTVQFAMTDEQGSEEMLIPLDKKLKLSGVKAVTELAHGDQVKVDYEVSYEDKKWEGEPEVLGTRALAVTLVKSAKPEGALYA